MLSDTDENPAYPEKSDVLILVLMEYALWLRTHKDSETRSLGVLILVLMEYALWL